MPSSTAAPAAVTQSGRFIQINTPLGKDVLLIDSLVCTEELSRPFELKVELLSTSPVSIDQLIGQPVCVTLSTDTMGNGDRVFHGIVQHMSLGPRDDRFFHYKAQIVPWLWLLTQKRQSRIFQDKNVIEIITAVFTDLQKSFSQLVKFRNDTIASYTILDYCAQYRETDFNFISRLMQRDGIFYYFEHDKESHTLVFTDANGKLAAGKSIRYEPEGIGEDPNVATHWEEGISVRPGKYTIRDQHFREPGKPLEHVEGNDSSALEIYDSTGDHSGPFNQTNRQLAIHDEGDRIARLRIEEKSLPGHLCHGSSICPGLATGQTFSLTQHFSANGKYIPIAISHSVIQSPPYISDVSSHPSLAVSNYTNSFACVPSSVPIRPRLWAQKPVIPGPQTAVVSVKSGEESWLDKFGRVRVQFHWDREGKNDENSTCWVRVSQPWAGNSWGAHFWPRVGQEVVVTFLEGDPDRPIITGSVYNAGNMPPYELPMHYTRSGILTRSSKHGLTSHFNELRFEDKKGVEQIFLNAERDMDHRVEHDLREWIGNDKHKFVKAAQVEQVGGNSSHEIGGNESKRIDGDLSLKVTKSRQETIGQIYTVRATQELHLKADEDLVIDAGKSISIYVGKSVINLSAAGITIDGQDVWINSAGQPAPLNPGTEAKPDDPGKPDIADDGSKGGKLN